MRDAVLDIEAGGPDPVQRAERGRARLLVAQVSGRGDVARGDESNPPGVERLVDVGPRPLIPRGPEPRGDLHEELLGLGLGDPELTRDLAGIGGQVKNMTLGVRVHCAGRVGQSVPDGRRADEAIVSAERLLDLLERPGPVVAVVIADVRVLRGGNPPASCSSGAISR